jgi:mono/diheme cytochrome c family protein
MNATYNCSGPVCHGRDAASAAGVGNLSLSSAAVAYTQLVSKQSDSASCTGKTRVVPRDPANSLLVQKLRGQTTMCGAPMPVNADEITEAELKRITDWILGGACNN